MKHIQKIDFKQMFAPCPADKNPEPISQISLFLLTHSLRAAHPVFSRFFAHPFVYRAHIFHKESVTEVVN
ncbi:hypothetical protein [Shimia sp. Alg240-R146]|uniref:hypothetical protein n=1 Tax=Shimia sp. Alg240-R146 TaxID=2993449 RepID=UPI0022E2A984|nr:hypothetical protein [Shimia sp. Alg240-R146]